jgi:6-phosphofructokinase 1
MRIGILTGGGDCAGLNAVIASIVRGSIANGWEVVGFLRGWEGLLTPMRYRELTSESVRGISHLGGTILGSTNVGRFAAKVGHGDQAKIPDEILEEAISNMKTLEVDCIVAVGGDGTLSAAMQMMDKGARVIGVPKTIDNDLNGTDKTFGFSTAVQVVTDGIDRIHTTAASHGRTIICETMGRHAGWIALYSGLAGNAHAILIPEFPFRLDDLIEFLLRRKTKEFASNIIVIAEGAGIEGRQKFTTLLDKPEIQFGGVAHLLRDAIEAIAPGEFDMRATIFGHMQRGGSPNAEDRVLSKAYGMRAVQAIEDRNFGTMVSLKGQEMVTVPIRQAVTRLRCITANCLAYQTAIRTGVFIH